MTSPDAFGLSRLFISPYNVPQVPTLTQDWAGGIMTQWDPTSHANTVIVGPVTYRNLPVVSPLGLTTGTVLLAKVPGGYIVMGMLATVGNTYSDPIRFRSLLGDVSSPISSTALSDAGILNFLINPGRQYALDGCIFYNAGTSGHLALGWNGPPNMACKWSNWGTQNTAATHLLFDTMTAYGDANTQVTFGWGHSAVAHPKGWFATTDTGGLLQLRFGQATSSTTASIVQQGSWLRLAELGPSSGTTTYISNYRATGSRSYDKNGAYIGSPDGDNNMYMGSFSSRSFGNERHMWTFNAAQIRTDLTGATVLSAQMFLYCFRCDSAAGDYNWYWHTASTIQTTFPTGGFGGLDVQGAWSSIPAWASFDITAQITYIINNNANSVAGGPALFSDASTAFRGFGTANYQPYIQITYAK
jgi:hypothetical protein